MERSVLITCSATPPASPVRGCGARASVVDEVVEVCESKMTQRDGGDQLY